MGALICAALYFGCMTQEGDGGKFFRALFMMISKTIVQNYATLGISPAEVLRRANESFVHRIKWKCS